MKIQSMLLATSLALVPATAAFAGDDKKEAIKKAKEEAKKKALDAAKEKAVAKVEAKVEKAEAKVVAKKEAKKEADEAAAKALEDEKMQHAKNLGAIERISQVAEVTGNADLKATVTRLNEKEAKRHALAVPADAAAPAAKGG